MKRLLTAKQMKRCDSYTIDTVGIPSRELMQRAANAAFREIMSGGFDLTKVLCICGTGNNGGDGLAVAMLLYKAGVDVEFFLCGDVSRMTEECEYRYYALQTVGATEQETLDLTDVTLVVDAVLGIGISGEVRGIAADTIDTVSKSGLPVVALDIPSGINSDTGAIMGSALKAELTISFARLKPGHILYPGRTHCGKTIVADIGIEEDGIADDTLVIQSPEDTDIANMLPAREPHSHKGTYGRLLVVAGSEGMCGASYLSALGAYRSGAGLVELFVPKVNVPILQIKIPEAIVTAWEKDPAKLLRDRLRSANACVIGPGLGKSTDAICLVEEALGCNIPLLIDADGLGIISESDDLKQVLKRRTVPTVITPHLGEMSRLSGTDIKSISSDPIGSAAEFAREYGVICVQKDSATVISDGCSVFVNATGCSALAKGGSGDVLSGVIGAFLASGQSPIDSAVCGAYLHGKAGEIAAEEMSQYSVLASDTANSIGKAIIRLSE